MALINGGYLPCWHWHVDFPIFRQVWSHHIRDSKATKAVWYNAAHWPPATG
jgi:hypothetical protein